jgi:hypothetical protein
MVNSHNDKIRGIGIQCIVGFVSATTKSYDQPLEIPQQLTDIKISDPRTAIQENTMMLINNMGQGLLSTNVGKGIVAIAPVMRSKLVSPSKLTPRVVYKLLWHLVKSHRYRMGDATQAALLAMVFDMNKDFFSQDSSTDKLLRGSKIDFAGVDSVLSDITVTPREAKTINNLGVNTLLRLLRFLPKDYSEIWLSDLIDLARKNQNCAATLADSPDWQPSLFQLLSESIEKISSTSIPSDVKMTNDVSINKSIPRQTKDGEMLKRFELCLEFYALLLARRIRTGGEKVRSLDHYDFESLLLSLT